MKGARQQEIFNRIKEAGNKELWAVCGDLARVEFDFEKKLKAAEKENTKLKERLAKAEDEVEEAKSKPAPVTAGLPDDATDSEIRQYMRGFLVQKLRDGTLSAAEIAQLKDLFGLNREETDLKIEYVDFNTMCEGCPKLDAPAIEEAWNG